MQKNKYVIPTFYVVLFALVVFRCFQLCFGIDSLTGFTNEIFTDIVLYGTLLLFFMFLMVFVYFNKQTEELKETVSLNLSITKISIIIYAFLNLTFSFINLRNITDDFVLMDRNSNLLMSVIFTVTTSIVGLLTGISIFAGVLKAIYKREVYLLTFTPCFLMIMHTLLTLLTFFTKERTLVTISQNLLTLLFWMSALKFVFSYSKYECSSKIGNPFTETYVFALITCVLGAITVIPPALFSTKNYYALLRSEYIIMIPIFLLSASVSIAVIKNNKFLKN